MKHLRHFAITVLMALVSNLSSFAYDFEAGGMFFNIISEEENTCGLTNESYYNIETYAGDIVVPATVEYNGKNYTVTEICNNAFHNSQVTSVVLPETIVRIQKSAFERCASLSAINLPNTLATIEDDAFSGCESLTAIELPNSLTTIGMYAFYKCKFVSLTVPESVTTIGNGAFVDCDKLETVVLPNTITELGFASYGYGGGSVFSGCKSLKHVNIPTSISILRGATFAACSSLESLEIPSNITSIELSAFNNCTSLTSIEIPATVTEFGKNPFWGCVNLGKIKFAGNEKYFIENNCLLSADGRLITALDQSSVTIPNTIKTIDDGAFTICKSLEAIEIPNTVTEIGMYAFSGCSKLKSAVLPNTIRNINSGLLEDCSSLAEIEIPASVVSMGNNPFFGCTNLAKIEVEGDNYYFKDDCLISQRGHLVCALNKEKIVIPNGVSALERMSIGGNTALESLEIPESVFGADLPISECPNLKSIKIFMNDYLSIWPEALFLNTNEINPDCKFYVPVKYVERLKDNWIEYADMIEGFYVVGDKLKGENGFTYTVTAVEDGNMTCELTVVPRVSAEVRIPESIEGFAVTSISVKFPSARGFKTLYIPKTVKSICDNAFNSCNTLTEVYCFPVSMEQYGAEVFSPSANLKIYVPATSVETYKTAWANVANQIFPMDETVSIKSVLFEKNNDEGYNLQGQRVGNDYKGIVIKNGRKVLAK